ncbi:hypothetical protein CDL15_Pgr018424 [Punica granatum]|uniref:Uncharacterized protein n=1 Tax=Punica granatum TaxID=22663 RepID=A0A218WYI2_PUNGR|nr:hypothetical protein CDL15_Pgr018424 [Punica granatum]
MDKEPEPEVESQEPELQSSGPLSANAAKTVDACEADKSAYSPMESGALALPQPTGSSSRKPEGNYLGSSSFYSIYYLRLFRFLFKRAVRLLTKSIAILRFM